MPKGKKKKFIDRKNAVTFHLVHRSQQDPLLVDETAPQHVLVAATARKSKDAKVDEATRREREKYGVYFDDDYNYLQHLKEVGGTEWVPAVRPSTSKSDADVKVPSKLPSSDTKKLNLPSSVFASEFEEDVGLLNKDAPQSGLQLDLDPDVVASMDPDFDFSDPDNILEDNFMELANGDSANWLSDDEGSGYGSSSGEYAADSNASDFTSDDDEDEDDDVASLNGPQYSFTGEETKSRFTEYSMSSSVMRRNEQLTLLDNRFENMFAAYDDSEIGALDCEEIEGHVAANSDIVLQCAEEFKRSQALEKHKTDTSIVNKCLEMVPESDEDMVEELEVPEKVDEKWDCQSILSTYSNIYNRPKIISEPKGPARIRVSGRTGVPLDVLDGNNGKLTARALAQLDASNDETSKQNDGAETVVTALSVLSVRPKDETPEDRRERKKALKDYRKERRLERKANTLAFKEEKKRQEKVVLNNMKNKHAVSIV